MLSNEEDENMGTWFAWGDLWNL